MPSSGRSKKDKTHHRHDEEYNQQLDYLTPVSDGIAEYADYNTATTGITTGPTLDPYFDSFSGYSAGGNPQWEQPSTGNFGSGQ